MHRHHALLHLRPQPNATTRSTLFEQASAKYTYNKRQNGLYDHFFRAVLFCKKYNGNNILVRYTTLDCAACARVSALREDKATACIWVCIWGMLAHVVGLRVPSPRWNYAARLRKSLRACSFDEIKTTGSNPSS
jgi:hypothetical protein